MKRAVLLCFIILSGILSAQVDEGESDTTEVPLSRPLLWTTDPPLVDTIWRVGGNFGLQFNQAAYSNWQAGGVNSVAGNSLLSMFANYDAGGKWNWNNSLLLGYGMAYRDTLYNKTDDRIELESRVDRFLSPTWSASGLLNFRSQFAPGYKEPGKTDDKISDFMSPGYLVNGLGLTYKPVKSFSAFISPSTTKLTFVLNQRMANAGAFGVDTGQHVRVEFGGYVNINYKQKLMKNVELQGRLNLYTNYLGNMSRIDVNSELILFLKVNKYITANVSVNAVYDHDVKFDVNHDGVKEGPRTQFREIIGVGISYDFGDDASGEK